MAAIPLHEPALEEARERLDSIRRQGPLVPLTGCLREQVADVVIVACSSRGGSTPFAELLRRLPGLINFSAEINPFLRLAGLTYPESRTGSDVLSAADAGDAARLEALDWQLQQDCGEPVGHFGSEVDFEQFVADVAWRLSAQWPQETFTVDEVRAHALVVLDDLERTLGWPPGSFPDPGPFYLRLLLRLKARHSCLEPYYYDLDPGLIRQALPGHPIPAGPPSPLIIEEPPFVALPPFRRATAAELATRPLVIKTPSNVYRLAFLRRFFSHARFRVLHLVRNAAASTNGLFDGWKHRGFFSYRLPVPLDLAGYTDTGGYWARHWWKFDLPPGWEAWTRRSLLEVCGFQWLSAHQATLDFVAAEGADYHRVHFEEIVDPERRAPAMRQVARWLGVDEEASLRALEADLPVSMATERPRRRRWLDRAPMIEGLVRSAPFQEMMVRLDYDSLPDHWT